MCERKAMHKLRDADLYDLFQNVFSAYAPGVKIHCRMQILGGKLACRNLTGQRVVQ